MRARVLYACTGSAARRSSVGVSLLGRCTASALPHRLPARSLATAIEQDFERVCAAQGPRVASSGTDAEKLRAYSLYKQATVGDVTGDRPSAFAFLARIKWDAWAALKGTSKEVAMSQYVAEFGGAGTAQRPQEPPAPVAPPPPPSSSASGCPVFETLLLEDVSEHVVEVRLNRPAKSNAFSRTMWADLHEAFRWLGRPENPARAVVLTGAGKNFTAGLDLGDHVGLLSDSSAPDAARRAWALREMIGAYQDAISAVEACPKPVIAAVHGACVGAGVDLISAADVRLASSDAFFSIKEVDVGLAADVGTLQRLPRVVGNGSVVRELAFTGRRWPAAEAMGHGLLSRVLPDRDALLADARALAAEIAAKSPVAVQGTKLNLNYSRDHSVQEGLEWARLWNMSMLQTGDLPTAAAASMSKTTPVFPKL